MKELNKHKRADRVKWFVVFLSILLLTVGLLSVITHRFTDWSGYFDQSKSATTNNTYTAVCGDSVQILSNTQAVNTSGVTQTLTAVVLPADAVDKSVDWSIRWVDNDSTTELGPISNYLTVVANSDGSNIADVTALQSFRGHEALVVVSTRVGGLSAFVTVTYNGIPSGFNFDHSLGSRTPNAMSSANYTIQTGVTETINYETINAFDDVSVDYSDFSYEITAVGMATVRFRESTVENLEDWSGSQIMDCAVTFTDTAITLNFGATLEGFINLNWLMSVDSFDDCYYLLTIKEENSGISESIKLWVETGVESISTSGSIVF